MKVLAVDDEPEMRAILKEGLEERGLTVQTAGSVAEAIAALDASVDVLVTDLRLQQGSGLELCSRATNSWPDVPVIVVTAFGSMETAVAAMRSGAWDFVTKPLDMETLGLAVERALAHRNLRVEVRRLRKALASGKNYEEMIGNSQPMLQLFDVLGRVGPQEVTVLITGESGTGKELVARALHAQSPRSKGPMIAINCAALPENLLESELFGYVRGAFTDARAPRSGLLVQAQGGTLFLDEIAELSPSLQAKLLRALQERQMRPLGSDREVAFDVRVVAATNQDLEEAVKEGRFRADLYYRLAVISVELPPLRQRGNDILLLAQHFLETAASRMGRAVRSLSPEAARCLLSWRWPGNVRELQNCMERAVVLAPYETLRPDDLPATLRNPENPVQAPVEWLTLAEVEARHLQAVLEAVGGNRTRAAQVLGIDRATLHRKLARLS